MGAARLRNQRNVIQKGYLQMVAIVRECEACSVKTGITPRLGSTSSSAIPIMIEWNNPAKNKFLCETVYVDPKARLARLDHEGLWTMLRGIKQDCRARYYDHLKSYPACDPDY